MTSCILGGSAPQTPQKGTPRPFAPVVGHACSIMVMQGYRGLQKVYGRFTDVYGGLRKVYVGLLRACRFTPLITMVGFK